MNMGLSINELSLKPSVLPFKLLKETNTIPFPLLLEIAPCEAAIDVRWISLLVTGSLSKSKLGFLDFSIWGFLKLAFILGLDNLNWVSIRYNLLSFGLTLGLAK